MSALGQKGVWRTLLILQCSDYFILAIGWLYNVSTINLFIQEEITGKQIAMVSQTTGTFALSENSELVIFPPNSCCPVQHVEDKHTTSVKSCRQYHQFYEMLAGKVVSTETVMKFIQMSAGCIPLLFCCISKVLSSIIVVTDDAKKVLTIGNTYSMLPVLIEQALVMLVC